MGSRATNADRWQAARWLAAALCAFAAAAPWTAARAADVAFSGYASTDLRWAIEGRSRFTFNENTLGFAVRPTLDEKVWLYGNVDFVNTNVPKSELTVCELSDPAQTDPLRVEVGQAFLSLSSLGWSGLDVRIGKQRIAWGTGDRFNPTDNLNPDDMHDPLDFGKKTPTIGVLATAYAGPVTMYGVLMPFFEPATLPLADVHGVAAAQFPDMAKRLHIDSGSATLDHDVAVMMGQAVAQADLRDLAMTSRLPEAAPENMQAAFKIAGRAGLVDLSASYQYVIDDFGVPKTIIIGVPDPLNVRQVDVELRQAFPRLHVIGADMAASLPFLWDLGVWAEGAYFIPQHLTTVFEADAGSFNDAMLLMGGRYGQQGIVVGYDRPTDEGYLKATAGFDYTFPGGWYLNAQFVRGLPNDNTNELMENYAFAGLDKPFFYDTLKTRLFGGYCFGDDSWILFPQMTWEPYKSVELVLGGLLVFGGLETKFGAFGDDVLFTRAKVSFK